MIDFKPDLLIIGGIRNNGNVDAIRNVVLQGRQKINPEIIFMNEIFGKMGKKEMNCYIIKHTQIIYNSLHNKPG